MLFLSAKKKSLTERVHGLEVGADDYLAKPFAAAELIARVKALLRRSREAPTKRALLTCGSLRLDIDAHKTYIDDRELNLWPKEFYLLAAFLDNPDKMLTRQTLLSLVWGPGKETARTPKVVDVTISNLNQKLERYGDRIVTIRGLGFSFDTESKTDKTA